jgi:uncharacterized membrane protein (DUF4010 family)
MPSLTTLFIRFGMALVLGFLIGLEREREKAVVFAGMRTFALISLLGAMMAFVSEQFAGQWLMMFGFAAVAGFGLVSYFRGFDIGHTGITTEVVFLVAFMLGAMVYWDLLFVAAPLTVVVILLLTFKPNLQTFAARVDREDILAALEFAVVWIIVLPLLPNQTYDPLDVLNPREIWVMVVLVSGINLASYILSQAYGARRGIGLTGVLGGMVSSTVVTFQFSRRSSNEPEQHLARLFALAIVIASTGMFVRVVVLTLILNTSLGIDLILPMLAGGVVMGLGAIWFAFQARREQTEQIEPSASTVRSPFALRPALQFGLMFAIVLLASKAAQVYLGETGTYLSSTIGGIAGLDAVALSMAKLASTSVSPLIAMRSVTLGAAANTIFKGIIATMLGTGAVRKQVLPLFLLSAAASLAVAFLIR